MTKNLQRWFLLVAVLATGCGLGLDYGGSSFGDADDDDADDASEVSCASASTLTATFGGGSEVAGWYAVEVDGGTVSQANHSLVLATSSSASSAALRSHDFYDFRAGTLELEVLDTSLPTLAVELRDPASDAVVTLSMDHGQLLSTWSGASAAGGDTTVPFDQAAHRFWRIGGVDGRLQWAASADRVDWTILRDEEAPDALRFAQATIIGSGTTTPAASAHVSGVNPDAPAPVWCGADELTDDFDGGALAPQWAAYSNPDCDIGSDSGIAELAMSAGATWCALQARRPIDLRDATLTVEVPTAGTQAYLGLTTEDETFEIAADPIYGVDAERNGVDLGGGSVSIGSARWWRVTGTDVDLTFSVSADGVSYQVLREAKGILGLDAVLVTLGSAGSPSSTAVVQFDNVNLAPP